MESLARKYRGQADFYILYVREAHPGENFPAHKTFDDKLARANEFNKLEPVSVRKVLVDNLEGTMHKDYGAKPNSLYVIGRDGVISYRADWADPKGVERHLSMLLENDGHGSRVEPVDLADNYEPATPGMMATMSRVIWRAGWRSAVDLWASSSRILRAHVMRSMPPAAVPQAQVE